MVEQVYLDNAATSKVADEVLAEMQIYFSEKYGNASSIHTFGQDAQEGLQKAREAIAQSINAEPYEIVFTSGGSESNNLALRGAFTQEKNHMITSAIEHPAILETCRALKKQGVETAVLAVDGSGRINLKILENSINDKTFLVSIMHANNEVGVLQDIGAIGKLCKAKGVLFHTDAVQSYTKVPIDVKKMNIDLMSLSAHKIHGPKGIGVLYVRKGVKLNKQITGGHHEFNMRAGTENVPGAVGFAKASQLTNEEDIKRMTELREYLIDELLKIPNTVLNGSREYRLCNNVNISFKGIEGESIMLSLDAEGIMVSTGSACSSASLAPSHVLMALQNDKEQAHGSIRFSLSKYTKKEELDYVIEKTKEVAERLRKISPLT